MQLYAKDIMAKSYDTINKNDLVKNAIDRIMSAKVRPTGHKTVSLMVVDDSHRLVGTISMYYILYHFRPSFLNYGIDSEIVALQGELDDFIKLIKLKKVDQVMNSNIISIPSDEPLMAITDRMIKDRIRRIPVVDKGKLSGVVYFSDIFYHLFHR